MTGSNIKHFEQLWEEAEKRSTEVHKDVNAISIAMSNLCNSYSDIDKSELPNEIKNSLKKKYLGELLFLITSLSGKDNIDVYSALVEELRMSS